VIRVLIVDDERPVRDAVARALRLARLDVAVASDGYEALAQVAQEKPDLVVLDVLMPGIDGIEVCRRLRGGGDRTPILMLTARDAVPGADDYLVKPFAVDELRARVRALLRRTITDDHGVLRFADVSLDPASHEVYRGERRIELTRTEFLMLELFLLNPRQVLTRSIVFERVWGYDFGPESNSLAVYIGHLRRKLEEGGEPRLLHTIRGVGYILREP
jgi:two-component system, OmpR family, response regulator MprA